MAYEDKLYKSGLIQIKNKSKINKDKANKEKSIYEEMPETQGGCEPRMEPYRKKLFSYKLKISLVRSKFMG